jgi:phosphatidylglycerophosphate synthase
LDHGTPTPKNMAARRRPSAPRSSPRLILVVTPPLDVRFRSVHIRAINTVTAPYQPTSRRPIADAFRKTAGLAVRLCLRWHVHPDVISYASIVLSTLAALCFWYSAAHPFLLLIAPLLCYARLWCNMLDGMVAVAAGIASPRGEIFNDFPDRLSDVLIFTGVAHSGLCAVPAGYLAAIFALLTAYVGTLGQAVGARREFGGVMSKPWRMVLLHVGAWTTFALLSRTPPSIHLGPLTVLDWTCALIILGCVQTIVVRLQRIFSTLSTNERG